ncbi:MAG TPA: hypothetical protein VGK67_24760 [Myxococcales bacterium]|jgi:hypothetical protein
MHTLRFALGLILLGVLAAGCQGQALHRVDDAALADLALEEKTQIALADSERARALESMHLAKAGVDAARRDVSVAEAEVHRRQAEIGKAQAELDYAFTRHDQAKITSMRQTLDLEREGMRVAESNLAVARERLAFSEHRVEVAQADHRWADAKYELERAKLAARKGRTTFKDMPVRAFEEQSERAHRDLIDARLGANRHEDAVEKAQRTYEEQEKLYKEHLGTESQ